MESYGPPSPGDVHPPPDPKSHQGVIIGLTIEDPSPSPPATRPQTTAPGREERRKETLENLKTADVIDLTSDDPPASRHRAECAGDSCCQGHGCLRHPRLSAIYRQLREINNNTSPSPAATQPQTMATDMHQSPAKHRADLEALKRPAINPTDDDSPLAHGRHKWDSLAVYPTSLRLVLKDGLYANDNGGIDPHSTEVVLKPMIGYPVSFHLFRDSRDGFTGKYGEDETGIISLDLREVDAMIQHERREGGFLAYIWSPE
ncbi:hypothetical protein VTG60DRAFT_7354 [Thermothelomyces hinnuleus]